MRTRDCPWFTIPISDKDETKPQTQWGNWIVAKEVK